MCATARPDHAGDRLIFRDPEAFAERVCPRFFRHSKWVSFSRMLNMYEFRKISTQPRGARNAKQVFEHEGFLRGREDLLHLIRRLPTKPKAPPASGEETAAQLRKKCGELEKAAKRVPALEARVAELERENAELRARSPPAPAAPAPAARLLEEDRRTAFAQSRMRSLSISSGGGSGFSLTMDSIRNIFASTGSRSPGSNNGGSFFSNAGGSFFSNGSGGSGERSPTALGSFFSNGSGGSGERSPTALEAQPPSDTWGILARRPSADLWNSIGFGTAPPPRDAAVKDVPPAARFVEEAPPPPAPSPSMVGYVFGEADALSPVAEDPSTEPPRSKHRRLSRPDSGL